MNLYRMSLRCNLENDTDRKVAAFLQNLEADQKSRNRYVIDLIADHIDRLEREPMEDEFMERLRLMLREEMQDLSVVSPSHQKAPALATELTQEEEKKNAELVLADLAMFG